MITSQNNIPKLRFPEFGDVWEVKKVGELCDSIVPGRNKPTEFNGEIPWITTPDIEHNGVITFSKKGLNISRDEAKKVGSKIVPINSIIISCVGDLGLSAIAGKEIVINQQLHAFLPKEKIQNRFLLYQLNLQKKYMDKVATKTAVPYMNKDNCNSIPISFPTLPEQQKIATFLSTVDEKLQAVKKKKSLLETYKKGVMQKLFSQEIRFKNDEGDDFKDWEVKRLEEIGEFKNGINKGKEDFGFGFPFINLMDVFGKPTISDLKLGLVNANEKELKLYELKKGDVLFIRSSVKKSGVGETALVLNDLKNTVFSGFLIRFRDEKIKLDLSFKKYCFANKQFRENLISLSTTSANTNINQESLNDLEVPIPPIPEQTKIGNFLSAIDEKINKVDAQIKQTEFWKKGLLQQMFV